MAGGPNSQFQNEMAPVPMFKVGNAGDTGTVEVSLSYFLVRGKTPL